jgi:predicted DNA-binding protein (MmcQ/YjbR family)
VSAQRSAALALCAKQDGAELSYPFGERTAVYKVGGKIFALIGLEDTPAHLSLKCEPEYGEALRSEHATIIPGYHLNKRHWISVILDGSIPARLIEELIEDSFDLVAPRTR